MSAWLGPVTGAEPGEGDLRRVLACYGLAHAAVTSLPGGMVNVCYKIEAGGESFVLKWYRPELVAFRPGRVQLVAEFQERVRRVGLAIPKIVRTADGELVKESENGCFVLSEFVAGRQFPRGNVPADCARSMGVFLHRLLSALAKVPGAGESVLPSPEAAMERHEALLKLARARKERRPADVAAVRVLEERVRGLHKWSGPAPVMECQWIHGDYQDSNVIFGADASVAGVVDWDNLRSRSRGYEVMRAFNYSFLDGDPSGLAFLSGYVAAARPTVDEAAGLVDLWDYVNLTRTWPIETMYAEPQLYQERWDVFVKPSTAWWEENKVALKETLVRLAGDTWRQRGQGPLAG